MQQQLKWMIWGIMAGLATILFLITIQYLSFKPDVNFLLEKQDIVNDPLWRPTFYVHVISGMFVILIGPFQFLKPWRNRNLKFHRIAGKLYVYGILFFAAPSGFIMAFYAEGGFWSGLGFVILSVLWFVFTLIAVIKIRARQVEAHRIWMMRSFALSFAAVTLRLLVPVLSELMYDQQELIVISTAWLSWLLNLLIAEGMIFVRLQKTHRNNLSSL